MQALRINQLTGYSTSRVRVSALACLAVVTALTLVSAPTTAEASESTPVNASPEQVRQSVFVAANLMTDEKTLHEEAVWLKIQNQMLKANPGMSASAVRAQVDKAKSLFGSPSPSSTMPQRSFTEVAGEIVGKLVDAGTSLSKDKEFLAAFEILKKDYMSGWGAGKSKNDGVVGRPGGANDASTTSTEVAPTIKEAHELAKKDPRAKELYDASALSQAAKVDTGSSTTAMIEAQPELDLLTPLVDPNGGVTTTEGSLEAKAAEQIAKANQAVADASAAAKKVADAQDDAAKKVGPFGEKGNPLVASDDEDVKKAVAAINKEEERIEKELKVVKGLSHALGALISLSDPEAGEQFVEVADATIEVAGSVIGFATSIARLAAGDPTAIMGAITSTANLAETIGKVIPIFFPANPEPAKPPKRTPEQVLMEQVKALRDQVKKFETNMNKRFDRVEKGLDLIYTDMNGNFTRILERLDGISHDLGNVKNSLDRTEQSLESFQRLVIDFERDGRSAAIRDAINNVIRYRDSHPGGVLPASNFTNNDGAENVFHSYAVNHSFDTFATGPATGLFTDATLVDELDRWPLESRLQYLSRFGQHLGASPFAQARAGKIAGVRDWAMAAGAYASLVADWPELARTVSPGRLAEIEQVGRDLRSDLARISAPDVPAADGAPAKSSLFQRVLANYRRVLTGGSENGLDVDEYLTQQETEWLDDRGIDPFGSVDQTPKHTLPEDSKPKVDNVPSCDAGAGSTLAAPGDLAGMFPQQYMNAHYLGALRQESAVPDAIALCYTAEWGHATTQCNYRYGCITRAAVEMTVRSTYGGTEVRSRRRGVGDTVICGRTADDAGGSEESGMCTADPYPLARTAWDEKNDAGVPLRDRFGGTDTDNAAQTTAFGTIVSRLLRKEQGDLYSRIAARLPGTPKDGASKKLDGAKRVLASFASAGFPRAMANDAILHGLLLGGDGLLDERELVKLYAQAAADPPAQNARLYLRKIGDARVKAAEDALWKYTDKIAQGQWRESDPLVEATMLRLKIARSIVYEPAGPVTPPPGDADGDGVKDPADNCPSKANPNQADSDGSGGGDACDPDDDNDGLPDAQEVHRRTSVLDMDSDDDGVGDGSEAIAIKSNPAKRDTDGDGLTDGLERGVIRGVVDPIGPVRGTALALFRPDRDPKTKTNALKRDTDRDGLTDGREDRNRNGKRERTETDPLKRDTDGDGKIDSRDPRPLRR